ncbi:MAG TPA: hypothetical protein VIM06_08165, partial [Rhodanobacter sp.]
IELAHVADRLTEQSAIVVVDGRGGAAFHPAMLTNRTRRVSSTQFGSAHVKPAIRSGKLRGACAHPDAMVDVAIGECVRSRFSMEHHASSGK